ncbi:hypothetical protein [Massilia sp. CCM 8734]|uniref:hypothetical protein n=1 Tax=Massilia sp. CCM 8734 TaxID=2609283 RepID=UPI001E5905D7|nr:hypothetical protein [Massilia sp. CCM 8734]
MNVATLAAKARKHWELWLPEKTEQLKLLGEWSEATQTAAIQAHRLIVELKTQGFQQHEAEEQALSLYILLTPEPAPTDDWEARELAELEREYQSRMQEPAPL